jgi:hypothetical protein
MSAIKNRIVFNDDVTDLINADTDTFLENIEKQDCDYEVLPVRRSYDECLQPVGGGVFLVGFVAGLATFVTTGSALAFLVPLAAIIGGASIHAKCDCFSCTYTPRK